jgi:hypothetical protein
MCTQDRISALDFFLVSAFFSNFKDMLLKAGYNDVKIFLYFCEKKPSLFVSKCVARWGLFYY